MGAAAADFNHDGLLDIVKTNFSDDVPTLYQNNGKGFFTDVSYRAGLGVNTRFLGWGVGFVDFDHDGWKDILIVNGHIYPAIDALKTNSRYRQEKELFWNIRNGAFLDITSSAGPGLAARHSSRGAAFADLNGDGAIEVVVNNIDDSPSLLVNRGEKKNWLIVKTRGTRSNRDGIGARVKIRAGDIEQMDEVRSGGSYLSSNELSLHFGVADATIVDSIEVRWPSGLIERFPPQTANQRVVVEEGAGVR